MKKIFYFPTILLLTSCLNSPTIVDSNFAYEVYKQRLDIKYPKKMIISFNVKSKEEIKVIADNNVIPPTLIKDSNFKFFHFEKPSFLNITINGKVLNLDKSDFGDYGGIFIIKENTQYKFYLFNNEFNPKKTDTYIKLEKKY